MWNADFFWSKSILGWAEQLWVKKRPWFLGWFLLLSQRRLYLPWTCGYSAHSYWWRQTCSHLSFSQGTYPPPWNIFFISVSLTCHFLLKKSDLSSKKINIKEHFNVARAYTHRHTLKHTHSNPPVSYPESKMMTKDHQGPSPNWKFFQDLDCGFLHAVFPPAYKFKSCCKGAIISSQHFMIWLCKIKSIMKLIAPYSCSTLWEFFFPWKM